MTEPTTPQLTEEAVREIEARTNAATEGPWESDNEQDSEHYYQFYKVLSPDSHIIFDKLNSDVGEIHEEADEDGVYRWDEVARRNIAFASHAREDVPALIRDWRAMRAERLEIQRVLASTALEDPTEDDEPPYSATELIEGVRFLIHMKDAARQRTATLREQLNAAADLEMLARDEIAGLRKQLAEWETWHVKEGVNRCGHHPCHQYDLRRVTNSPDAAHGCVSCERDGLQSQLAQVTSEREERLIEVLDNFRSKNIRRIDLIVALLKEGLIHADERNGQLTTNE